MGLTEITERIRTAERAAGRPEGSVALIAVSKVQPDERVRAVLDAGHRHFGENKVQEAEGKWPAFREEYPDVRVDLIGPLQSNKARRAMELFEAIHSLDRPKLAKSVARLAQETGRCPDLFVQVNTGEEAQKAGILPDDTDAFVEECRGLDLPVRGLMCIPPVDEAPSLHFALLAKLAARNGLDGLSMGMSGDFEEAIALGATHVRIGSAIFGEKGLVVTAARIAAARIVFDLDGTLIDSAPDIRRIANAVLAEEGAAPLSRSETVGFIGAGAGAFVSRMRAARGLPEASEPDLLDRFIARYEGAHELTRPYSGTAEALAALEAAGHRLGLCTNKPEGPARSVIAHLGLSGHFGPVVGGDTLAVRKPDPAPLRAALEALGAGPALYVGDSETDAETAAAAGIPFLLFTGGYRKTKVAQIAHAAAFDDHSALAESVARLLERAALSPAGPAHRVATAATGRRRRTERQ